MKKFILFTVILLSTLSATAQKGRSYVGAGVNYGTDIKAAGIGVKYGYGLSNRFHVEANFNYFIKEYHNQWDVNLDLQYRFYVVDKLSVYPIVGLSYAHLKYDLVASNYSQHYKIDKIGGNFGAGVAYDLTDRFFVNADLKYRAMAELGQGVFQVAFGYRF